MNFEIGKIEVEIKTFAISLFCLGIMWYSLLCYFKPELVDGSNIYYPLTLSITLGLLSLISGLCVETCNIWFKENEKITHIHFLAFTIWAITISTFAFISTTDFIWSDGEKESLKTYITEYIKATCILAILTLARGKWNSRKPSVK